MPTLDKRTFRKQPNAEIMNAIRGIASSDYKRRIPDVTKANIQDGVANLMNYSPSRNEFANALINKVGMQIARSNSWTNPLAVFKIGMLGYGESIEETMTGLVQSYVYDPTRSELEQTIFGAETPEIQANYHKINRQEYYKITINDAMLRRAFASEYGLSDLISQLMESPTTSDQWDEYLQMVSLLQLYDENDGYFQVNVPDVSAQGSNVEQVKFALRRLRETAENMTFISRRYNASHMPVAAKREEMVILTTPEFRAALDVEALAAAFNIDRADVPSRMVTVRQEDFGIPGAQAILTTEDFFVVADTLLETRSISNPAGLYDNYFLHHHGIISMSRFVPAVLFTTEPSTPIEIPEDEVTGVTAIKIYNDQGLEHTGALVAGSFYQVVAEGSTTPADGLSKAVSITAEGFKSERSMWANTGSIYVSQDELAATVKFTATSIYDETKSVTVTKTITGGVAVWPVPRPEGEPEVDPTP